MDASIIIGQWLIPLTMLLFSIYLFIFPAFKTNNEVFGKANIHFTLPHVAASVIMLGLCGGIVAGVISYDKFKNAFGKLEIERDSLIAQNKILKEKKVQVAKLMDESNENIQNISNNLEGTSKKIERASDDLSSEKFSKELLEEKIKVIDFLKIDMDRMIRDIERQRVLNAKINTELVRG